MTTFDKFWDIYDNKKSRDKCLKKWMLLPAQDRANIMKALPAYIKSTPERQYRKHPLTYLNQLCWKDTIYKEGEKKIVYTEPTKPIFSNYKAEPFLESEGLEYMKERIKNYFKTGVYNIKDYGGAYTNRLKHLIDVPKDVKQRIKDKVEKEATRPRNRFEPPYEGSMDQEIRDHELHYFLRACKSQGREIYKEI